VFIRRIRLHGAVLGWLHETAGYTGLTHIYGGVGRFVPAAAKIFVSYALDLLTDFHISSIVEVWKQPIHPDAMRRLPTLAFSEAAPISAICLTRPFSRIVS
jgi:hypothetical protein